jgi:hypothetical protein
MDAQTRSELAYRFKRLGRHLLWPHPALYWPIGMMRRGELGNVFRHDYDIYISGYPRSGNTFALKAFLLANPGVAVRSHRHIPTFILVSIKRNTPGMVLVRSPLDAAVSWAIHRDKPLRHALQYYRDFYCPILHCLDQLFIVRFEEITKDFGQVMRAFNARWKTSYNPFVHSPENVAACMRQIEDDYRGADGKVRELLVPRPSADRAAAKQRLLAEMDNSPVLQDELRRTEKIYDVILKAADGTK